MRNRSQLGELPFAPVVDSPNQMMHAYMVGSTNLELSLLLVGTVGDWDQVPPTPVIWHNGVWCHLIWDPTIPPPAMTHMYGSWLGSRIPHQIPLHLFFNVCLGLTWQTHAPVARAHAATATGICQFFWRWAVCSVCVRENRSWRAIASWELAVGMGFLKEG